MQHPFRLGLTGGIGSGKSTVAAWLADRGAVVIDADAISRQLTAPAGKAITAIAATFGSNFIQQDGAMDRDQMRQLVFKDPTAKKRLEAILHPLVAQESAVRAQAATESACPCLVFDIPLLVESSHWRQKVDRILVIDCTTQTQINRVMQRNGLARASVDAIISSQASRLQRLTAADWVIFNDDLSFDALYQELQSLAPLFGL